MADDVKVSDDPTIAADVINDVAYQRTKSVWGVNNVAVDTSASAPMPVEVISGDITVGDLAVTSLPSLVTGTDRIGKLEITDGTTEAGVMASGANKGLYVGLLDGNGDHYAPAAALSIEEVPDIDASPDYSAVDNLSSTVLVWADAIAASGGLAHIVGVKVQDDGNQGPDLSIFFFDSAPATIPGQNSAWTITKADGQKLVAVYHTALGTWESLVTHQTCFIYGTKPVTSNTTDLYALVRVNATYNAASSTDLRITLMLVR